MSESNLSQVEQAYRVLGVPETASAHSIKHAHRKLLKRWHPDLYTSGTHAQEEATRMAAIINEAYSRIEQAPLRYYVRDARKAQGNRAGNAKAPGKPGRPSNNEHLPRIQIIESCIRFVFGAAFGLFLSCNLQFYIALSFRSFVMLGSLLTFACGFAALRSGDRFWQSILKEWLLWS